MIGAWLVFVLSLAVLLGGVWGLHKRSMWHFAVGAMVAFFIIGALACLSASSMYLINSK